MSSTFLNIDWTKVWSEFIFNPSQPLIFSSGFFVFLFSAFAIGYALLHRTHFPKVIYVLLFSLYFYYKSSGYYYLVLIFAIFFDYIFGHFIFKAEKKVHKQLLLAFSIVVNLGILFYFKYTNFFLDIFNDFSAGKPVKHLDIFLPVGVSFFTFQSMSYTIDIYRGKIQPVKNIIDYGFFVSFFPQLVAGPIVRAVDFIPQLYQPTKATKEMMTKGLYLIATGFFKKAIISDYISLNFVDRIFDNPSLYSGLENLLGVYGYSLQIYCDFSGYSDMAIGIALLLGFRFPLNFDSPYQSKNITEFWRRWHISLSTWLKDYLYFSLGGNRKGNFLGYFFPMAFFGGLILWGIIEMESNIYWPIIVSLVSTLVFVITIISAKDKMKSLYTSSNQMTTMLLGGFWHGADLRFIIWGGMHGLALAIHKAYLNITGSKDKEAKPNKLVNFLSILLTFHFVALCWIFFRAENTQIAWQVLTQIFTEFNAQIFIQLIEGYKLVFLLMVLGFVLHFIPSNTEKKVQNWMISQSYVIHIVLLLLITLLVVQIKSSDIQPFIYFQF